MKIQKTNLFMKYQNQKKQKVMTFEMRLKQIKKKIQKIQRN